MREYIIQPTKTALPALTGRVFRPEAKPFRALPYAPIDSYAWPGYCRPGARACVGREKGGLAVLLCAREHTVIAQTIP